MLNNNSETTLEPMYQPACCHNVELKGAVSLETLEPMYQPACCHNLDVKGAVLSETLVPYIPACVLS